MNYGKDGKRWERNVSEGRAQVSKWGLAHKNCSRQIFSIKEAFTGQWRIHDTPAASLREQGGKDVGCMGKDIEAC